MVQEYITYLTAIRGYSENTAIAYKSDLATFISWAKSTLSDARWSTINRDDIDEYVTSLQQMGLAAATTNRHLAAISGLYNYMKRNGLKVENPCRYESRRKLTKHQPNTIDTNELKKAYEAANGVTKVMLGLLASTGIRIQEMLDLQWEDINFNDCSLRIMGKGRKERIVYATPRCLETLQLVKAHYHSTGHIFTMEQRAARHMIYEALRPYCNARQLSPHAIRHTFATELAKAGTNVTAIAKVLGHESIMTTQKYIDMTQTDVKNVCQQLTLFN